MKCRRHWASYDIEGACLHPKNPNNILAIGATLHCYDPDEKKVVECDSYLIKMFRKHTLHTTEGKSVDVVCIETPTNSFKFADLSVPYDPDNDTVDYIHFGQEGFVWNDADGIPLESFRDDPVYNNVSVFDARTWEEFWWKHLDILDQICVPSDRMIMSHRAHNAKKLIQKKRCEWEAIAEADGGGKLITISNTSSYDLGTLEHVILGSVFHYAASDPKRWMGMPINTHSMQCGLLAFVDPVWWGRKRVKGESSSWTDRVRYLYDIPEHEGSKHDHNPMNDSDTIGREYGDFYMIQLGEYRLNRDKVEK